MTKQHFDLRCANGHLVTIRWARADVGIEPMPPARLYATPPIGLDASGAVNAWGIEQKCGECGEIVRHPVIPARL
jgi:hypothetical protein